MAATVSRYGILDMQVCVPADWSDDQVTTFAEAENPSGTEHGWQIRREGNRFLSGDPERCRCADLADQVHIMLDV